MPNITLSIPDDLKKQLDELPELNISESVRKFLSEKAKRALLLKELDKTLENSKLTDEDCLRLGRELKERVWKRHKQEGW
jgi:Arc/MetJ-type ribon-helix-helix transcriptional regulator